jgi:serine/threonine protein kinase
MKLVSKGLFKSIKEFKMLTRKLGNGSFGVVNLALHRATGRFYAIKIVSSLAVRSIWQLSHQMSS